MAILFLTHKFPPSIGGMQKQSYELINGIKKYSKTYVIAHSPAESKLWFFLRLAFRVRKIIRKHPEIRIVHCNDGVMAAFVALFIQKGDLKFCATYHGLDLVFPSLIYQKLILPRVRKFDRIICVSKHTAIECVKRGFQERQLVVIPNGVDLTLLDHEKSPDFRLKFQSDYGVDISSKRIIISIGRAVKRKGFSWFIKEVLPTLNEDALFIMAGPIASRNALVTTLFSILPDAISNKLELFLGHASDSAAIHEAIKNSGGRAIHLGAIKFIDLIQLLSVADIFIMPNRFVKGDMEGFGLVALEANLRDCPVLVSGIEGIRSAVHKNQNGLYALSENTCDWSNKINKILYDDEFSIKLVESAKAYVLKHFNWDLMALRYYKAFIQLGLQSRDSENSRFPEKESFVNY